ncbi:hypothetical protein [Bifidobacterium scardovii]|uniref:Uncharacterized protein n=1 Tax=Bifidobacterium scardovii TaxID=158787 RepID=A0A087DBM5_9BIFI|nr:hypothetical protein [Bifidobacterium scardovii]KFI92925.1 hypothetical protein BSCA_1655 [Bifidobacterium scardovii]MDK6350403.1 hypothetical protein [Bifidobacterium scardovii]
MNTLMMVLVYMREHPAAALLLAVFIGIGIAALMSFTRNAKKVDAVTAKPLALTIEQARQVTMQHRFHPTRFVFIIPATFATDDTINEWATTIAPRLGTGFQPVEVTIIPQKLWIPARYRVTFARLEALR